MGRKKRKYPRHLQTAPAAASAAQNGGAKKTAPVRKPVSAPVLADGETYFAGEKRGLWPTQILESAAKPYMLVQREWRREIPHMAAVFVAMLVLYALTTPRLVTLEDDGLFISNLHFFGVAHPPGYPVHTLLGSIFYHLLPFGTPAFKGHFFSGFAGAAACAAIYAVIAMLVRGRVFAYLGGTAYGASDTFWSQAIIAEVYTLNAALYFIVMALCIRYAGHAGRSGKSHRRLFMAITFVWGLGVANHYPLLFLGSVALGMVVLSQIGNIFPRVFLGIAGVLAGAAPPYLLMVWRSGYDPAGNPANFYGPIGLLGLNEQEKVVDFSFYVLRSGYSGVDKQSGVGWEDKLSFAGSLGGDMLWQFTPLGFVFAALGFAAMARSRYNWLWLSMTAGWFMTSFLLVYLLDFKAEYIWKAAFRVYHLLAYGIMAVWLAVGAAWAADKLRPFLRPVAWRQAGIVMLCLVTGLTVAVHWGKNNRREYRWAHDLAAAKLNSVEKDAVLFTFDDLDLPVGYLHFVEGVRSDLKVYNDQALVYGDRLYSPLTPDRPPQHAPGSRAKSTVLREFVRGTERPVYYHAARADLYANPQNGSDIVGFYRRVNRDNADTRIILPHYIKDWLSENIPKHGKIEDLWTRQQHYTTVSQLVNSVLLANLSGLSLDEEWLELIDRALEKNPLARITANSQRVHYNGMDEARMRGELEWMRRFDPESDPLLGRQLRATFYWQKAVFLRALKEEGEEEALQTGWRQNLKDPKNPATADLLLLYRNEGRHCDLIALAEEAYPKASEMPKRLLPVLRQARAAAGGKCGEVIQ